MRLRSHFAALAVGAVVPVLIFALVLVALHNRSLWLIGGGGLLILLGVTALWFVVGRRVARPIRAQSAAATALADAGPPTPRIASRIAAVDDVARALDSSQQTRGG